MKKDQCGMHVLGITGGIGSGKSEVLKILGEEPDSYILEADRLAHELMTPGHICYREIVDLGLFFFGKRAEGNAECDETCT